MNRLRECRLQSGLKQKQVADRIGVAPSIVSRWETGVTQISRKNLVKLAELYGVSIDYLLGNADGEQPRDVLFDDERALLDAYRRIRSQRSPLPPSSDEQELLDQYRQLSAQGREYLRQQLRVALSLYAKPEGPTAKE